eukprot:1503312-Amphidinium_carterae.1
MQAACKLGYQAEASPFLTCLPAVQLPRRSIARASVRSSLGSDTSEYLYGVYPVLYAMQSKRRRMKRLWVQESKQKCQPQGETAAANLIKDLSAQEELQKLAGELDAEMQSVAPKADLSVLSGGAAHQGFVLECHPWLPPMMEDLPDMEAGALWVVIAGATSAVSIGGVVRSAAFFGAEGVLCDGASASNLNGFTSKISAGALERVPVYQSESLANLLHKAQRAGWQVLAAGKPRAVDMGESLTELSCADLLSRQAGALPERSGVVLVMGDAWGSLPEELLQCCSAAVSLQS